MNDKVLSKIKKKKEAFERFKQTKQGKEYVDYTKTRNVARAETRKAVRDYEYEVAKLAKRNPKVFYRFVNAKTKTRNGISNLRKEDGTEITDDIEKVEVFNSFFNSVYTKENLQNIPNVRIEKKAKELSSIKIDITEVFKLLRNLQPDKSLGPEGIHPHVLKECAEELAGLLTKVFNKSLEEGQLPQSWKEANVLPIFKKGSRSRVSNYRPISLTSDCR